MRVLLMKFEYAGELDFQFILDNDRHLPKQLIIKILN